jgi:hypothetical protein
VQDLKEGILTGRTEVKLVRITGRSLDVRHFHRSVHDDSTHCQGFFCWQLFPEMPEELHELIALVRMLSGRIFAPYFYSAANQGRATSSIL